MVEEGDGVAQGSGHESSLALDSTAFSQFDSQDPDKALTFVRSVLTQRRQAVQVRTPGVLFSPPMWVSKLMCAAASPAQMAHLILWTKHEMIFCHFPQVSESVSVQVY